MPSSAILAGSAHNGSFVSTVERVALGGDLGGDLVEALRQLRHLVDLLLRDVRQVDVELVDVGHAGPHRLVVG